jgi:4-amino-4-deoxy-L-arabinose transferase-like glycosyltransferase
MALVGLAAVLFLFFWRLDVYPAPWFDEGAYMLVARTLVEDGVYAERSSDGYRFNGAVISTGPTVILPIAAVYSVFGVGVIQARLVMVGYGLLTLLMIYLVAKRLLPDWRFATTAVVLALLSWGNWMPMVFRTVMGEGPGAFFILTALWLWFAPTRPSLVRLAGVGLLAGLATVTKAQYALIIFPALALALLFELVWYKRVGWRFFVVPGLVAALTFALWLVTAYVLLGQGLRDQVMDATTARVTASLSYFTVDLNSIGVNLLALTSGQAYSGLYLIALLAAVALSLPRSTEGQRWGILTILTVFSVGFYLVITGVNPEHNRLAVPMYLFGSLAVARLLFALLSRYEFKWREAPGALRRGDLRPSALIPLVAVGLVITLVMLPTLRAAFNVTRSGGDLPYQAAAWLNDHAAPNALVETWDREMSVLTDHRYHFPPQMIQAAHNAHVANPELPSAGDVYQLLSQVTPDYIVIGPMSRWADLYPASVLDQYTRVFSAGEQAGAYEIFARR